MPLIILIIFSIDLLCYLMGFDAGYLYLLKIMGFLIVPIIVIIFYIIKSIKIKKVLYLPIIFLFLISASQYSQIEFSSWRNKKTIQFIENNKGKKDKKPFYIWDYEKVDGYYYTKVNNTVAYKFCDRPLGPFSIYDPGKKEWHHEE